MAAKVKIEDRTREVIERTRAATITSLGRAAAYIRGIAQRSIKISPVYSAPGQPPHSRKGRLKRAIVFAVDKPRQDAVIGPSFTDVGKIGSIHEFGGTETPKQRKSRQGNFHLEVGGFGPIAIQGGKPVVVRLLTERQVARATEIVKTLPASQTQAAAAAPRHYPPRPFMARALQVSRDRLPNFWARSVKGGG